MLTNSMPQTSTSLPSIGLKSDLVKHTLLAGRISTRAFLAWANSIALAFLIVGSVGLYEPPFVMSLSLSEGNTELDADDETMGGAVEMQLEAASEQVESPEVTENVVTPVEPEPVVEEQPEPEIEPVEPIEPLIPLTAEAVFPVEAPEPVIKPIKALEKPIKREPRPERKKSSPAPSVASTGVRSATVGEAGGASGTGTGLRTGGKGAKGKFPAPPYPAFARSKNAQGSVSLAITVDPTGTVTNVRVLSTSGFSDLDQYACSWVQRRWRWPADQARVYRQPVVFRLR